MHPGYGDGMPDAKYTSYAITISTGKMFSGDKPIINWVGSVDIIDTPKQTGIFLTHNIPSGATDCLCSSLSTKSFFTPQFSITKTGGLIWSDDIAEAVRNYSGPAEAKVAGVGPFTGETFSSTNPQTGKINNKVLGIGVGAGLSAPDASIANYYVKSSPLLIFNKPIQW